MGKRRRSEDELVEDKTRMYRRTRDARGVGYDTDEELLEQAKRDVDSLSNDAKQWTEGWE